MKKRDIAFLSGNVSRLASVKIRCQEIADRIGCDAIYNVRDENDVPSRYKAYICVKPDFGGEGAMRLAKRAIVVWDVLDNNPPPGMDMYISSTRTAADALGLAKYVIIPHHHCNHERSMSRGTVSDVAYVGSQHWYPDFAGCCHSVYFVHDSSRSEVAEAYRKVGLSLNIRSETVDVKRFVKPPATAPDVALHVRLNSGIKLINCLGFGIPSVSAIEPAYGEIAPECTLMGGASDWAGAIRRLQDDDLLYRALKAKCLERSEHYHVERIVRLYEALIDEL